MALVRGMKAQHITVIIQIVTSLYLAYYLLKSINIEIGTNSFDFELKSHSVLLGLAILALIALLISGSLGTLGELLIDHYANNNAGPK